MTKLPFYKMFPADADGDENFRLMTFEQRGAYWTLLNHAWTNDGLPDEEEELRALLRLGEDDFSRIWKRVGKCFASVDGRLRNPRQEKERREAMSKSQKATESVRTRYERSTNVDDSKEVRKSNVPIRASDSDICLLSSEASSEKKEVEVSKKPERFRALGAIGDEQFLEFRAAYDGTTRPTTDPDWFDAFYAWRVLDFEQKAAAIAGITSQVGNMHVYKPRKYLETHEWKRPPMPEKKSLLERTMEAI